jgi:methionine-rich copper-binding protein CopC
LTAKPASRLFSGGVKSRVAGLAAVLAAAVLAIVPTTRASAHDYLVSSSPTANSTVSSALPRVTLTFDDVVLDENGHGALVQVTDASGRNFETDCATVQGRAVSVPVALGAPGTYRVTWQIVSADGHPVSDSLQFTYSGPKAGDGREGPLAKCGTTVAAPKAQATGAPAQASVSPTVIVIIAVAGGIVVLAIIAVVLVVVLSGRRRKRAQS